MVSKFFSHLALTSVVLGSNLVYGSIGDALKAGPDDNLVDESDIKPKTVYILVKEQII